MGSEAGEWGGKDGRRVGAGWVRILRAAIPTLNTLLIAVAAHLRPLFDIDEMARVALIDLPNTRRAGSDFVI